MPITRAELSNIITATNHDFKTPAKIFDPLNKEFRFTLDACASPWNAQCKRYYTIEDDGLSKKWRGRVWCNPPFGNQTKGWVEKAYHEALSGTVCVLLVPSKTSADWWHDYCLLGEIRFLRGRYNFKKPDGSYQKPMFPNSIVIFDYRVALPI